VPVTLVEIKVQAPLQHYSVHNKSQ